MRWFKERTVIVVFADREEATRACEELCSAGFRRDQIDLVPPERQGAAKHHEPGVKLKEKAGAAFGGLIGGLIGCSSSTPPSKDKSTPVGDSDKVGKGSRPVPGQPKP